MEFSLITAFVSASSAVIVAGITYYLSKQREQEIEWRKLKLEHYKSYMAALSGAISSLSTRETQIRYAEAVNSLQLVAPESVISALYNFQEVIKYSNNVSKEAHDEALTKLMQAMRTDVHPALKHN